jgi:Phytanoyl-CoA dioxygenase (PhyH)
VRLSADECDRYVIDGYVVREAAFSAAEVQALRDSCEAVIARVVAHARRPEGGPEATMADGRRLQFSSNTVIQWEWRNGSQEVRMIEPCTHLDAHLDALYDEPRFTDPARDVLGVDELAPFTSKLNLKRPREGSEFPWHQDYPYWYVFTPEYAADTATVMLFLDDASAGNGALRVLPGSHARGPAPRDPNDPTKFLADPTLIDADQEVVLEVSAGTVCVFGPYLLHRSSPNTTDAHRRALLYSFQPAGRPRLHEHQWRPHLVDDLP